MMAGRRFAGRKAVLFYLLTILLTACLSRQTYSSEENSSGQNDKSSPQVSCQLSVSNTWQDGDRTAYQAGITLRNEGTDAIDPWVFQIDFGSAVTVSDYWNCQAETAEGAEKGSMVIFRARDYNSSLPAGGEVRDIGIIFSMDGGAEDPAGTYAVDPVSGKAERRDSTFSETEKPGTDGAGQPGTDGAGQPGTDGAGQPGTDDAGQEPAAESTGQMPETDSAGQQTETFAGDLQGTPFAKHGALQVSGGQLLDEHGEVFQLKGVSTHGIAWYPQFVNEDAFRTLRDDWGADLVRLVLYTDENGGYCTDGDQAELETVLDRGVQAASDLGMYVIIDWHVLHDLTPLKYEDRAEDFFSRMSAKYKDCPNVLYEICNEPNGGTSWSEIRQYAEKVIPLIRQNAPDAVVLVGTPTWSQDVDAAAAQPLENCGNVMYVLHFYAGTHKEDLRRKLQDAVSSGLPVFISEFSVTDASGDGAVDYESADAWKKLINENHLSYACWSLSDKAESSALLHPGAAPDGSWTEGDLSETGLWMKKMIAEGR